MSLVTRMFLKLLQVFGHDGCFVCFGAYELSCCIWCSWCLDSIWSFRLLVKWGLWCLGRLWHFGRIKSEFCVLRTCCGLCSRLGCFGCFRALLVRLLECALFPDSSFCLRVLMGFKEGEDEKIHNAASGQAKRGALWQGGPVELASRDGVPGEIFATSLKLPPGSPVDLASRDGFPGEIFATSLKLPPPYCFVHWCLSEKFLQQE